MVGRLTSVRRERARADCPLCAGAGAGNATGSDWDLEVPLRLLRELTPRELEVFLLLATAPGNAELAGRLALSERTVKLHVGRALGKLDLTRARATLAARLVHGDICTAGRLAV